MPKIEMKENLITFSAFGNVSEAEKVTKKARIFYAGKHKGKEYGEKALQTIADGFNVKDGVPVQLDHSTSARDTIGRVTKVEKVGDELFADLEILGRENVDAIRLGKWEKVSVGLTLSDDDSYKLQEVSVTPFPALKNAKMLAASDAPATDDKTDNTTKTDDVRMDEAPEIIKMKAQMESMQMEMARQAEVIRMKEDTETIEHFVQTGRTTPAMKKVELELFHSLTDDQRQKFLNYKKTQPQLVELGKVVNIVDPKKPGEFSLRDAEAQADELLSFLPSQQKTEQFSVDSMAEAIARALKGGKDVK